MHVITPSLNPNPVNVVMPSMPMLVFVNQQKYWHSTMLVNTRVITLKLTTMHIIVHIITHIITRIHKAH